MEQYKQPLFGLNLKPTRPPQSGPKKGLSSKLKRRSSKGSKKGQNEEEETLQLKRGPHIPYVGKGRIPQPAPKPKPKPKPQPAPKPGRNPIRPPQSGPKNDYSSKLLENRRKWKRQKKFLKSRRRRPSPIKPGDIIDYRNISLIGRFISQQGKILSRRVNRVTLKQQRRLTLAIKQARILSSLPFHATDKLFKIKRELTARARTRRTKGFRKRSKK